MTRIVDSARPTHVSAEGVHMERKGWGWERHIVNSDLYCGKILHVDKGKTCSMHMHRFKHETFTVIQGEMDVELINPATADKQTIHMVPGEVLVLPPMNPHRFTGTTDYGCTFVEFSTQDFSEDSYRVERGDSQRNPPDDDLPF